MSNVYTVVKPYFQELISYFSLGLGSLFSINDGGKLYSFSNAAKSKFVDGYFYSYILCDKEFQLLVAEYDADAVISKFSKQEATLSIYTFSPENWSDSLYSKSSLIWKTWMKNPKADISVQASRFFICYLTVKGFEVDDLVKKSSIVVSGNKAYFTKVFFYSGLIRQLSDNYTILRAESSV